MFICIQIKQLQSYVFYFILTSTTIKYHERTETRLRLPTSERAAAEQYNIFVILSIKRHIVFARMVATGTNFGRLCAFIDIAAYQTEPADRFLAFPDSAVFDGLETTQKAAFVAQLDLGNGAEMLCDFRKASLFGDFSRVFILLYAFDMLAFGSLTQIRHSIADSAGAGIDSHRHIASFEIFEENLAVMQLVVSCFGKNIGQTEIFFFCGLFCINKCSGYKPLTH